MKKKRPPQVDNLLEEIGTFIDSGNFRFSKHAVIRGRERTITPQDAVDVLLNGYHEKRKTTFDSKYKAWKYAIRGKTIDNVEVRVIVAIVEELIIITVIGLV